MNQLLNQHRFRNFELVEPQSTVLARLCVYCIVSTLEQPLTGHQKKRGHNTMGDGTSSSSDDLLTGPMAKMRKLDEANNTNMNDFSAIMDSANGLTGNAGGGGASSLEQPTTIREPLQTCLTNLFKTFGQFAVFDDLSPKIYFVFHFLTLLQQCGKDRIKPVLKLLPPGLVQNLLKVMITNEFTYDFILK